MYQILFLILSLLSLKVQADVLTERLDNYLASSKYGPSKNMVFSMGYDKIHDGNYVEQEKIGSNYIDLVDSKFARVNLLEPKITSITNATKDGDLRKPTHPFSAAQRSLVTEGLNMDRWDVKVNDRGHQFFGLYYGNDTFVTNRLRAHLLLWIINGIKDYLAIFDGESLNGDAFELEKELSDKIKWITKSLANRIKQDKLLLTGFEFGDPITPVLVGGSLVCVSNNYLIVSLMGDSNVLLYDQAANRLDLLEEQKSRLMYSYFLSNEYHDGSPFVKIIPRKYRDSVEERIIRYVILKSSSIGELVTEEIIDEQVKDVHLNFRGESIFTNMLAEDVMQKAEYNWLAQDSSFKNRSSDFSLLIAELKD